MVNRLFRPTFL